MLKPGWKTTEFWVTALAGFSFMVAPVVSALPDRYAVLGTAMSVFAYNLSRGIAKAFPPKDNASWDTSPVVTEPVVVPPVS